MASEEVEGRAIMVVVEGFQVVILETTGFRQTAAVRMCAAAARSIAEQLVRAADRVSGTPVEGG